MSTNYQLKYYQENKEKMQKKSSKKIVKSLKKRKREKRQYGRKRYKTQHKFVAYRKK